jgi:putative membrane protein
VVLGSVAVGPAQWLAFAGSAVAVGAVFALANQGLAAALGGAGRLLSLGIALVALTAGLTSTVPPIIASTAAVLPTAPATTLLRSTLTDDATGAWASLALLALVAAAAALLVFAGVASRRRVRAGALAGEA